MARVDVHGVAFHVEDQGEGEPLVLLHGFTGSSESWHPVAECIAADRRVITIDMLGHGRTDAPSDLVRYAFDEVIDDLVAVAAVCDIGSAAWLGYSMGARLALGIALHHQDLVSSLILESVSPGIPDDRARAERRDADEALAQRIVELGIDDFVDSWERLPLWDSQLALPAETLKRQRQLRLRNAPVGLANSLRGMGQGAQPSFWNQLTESHVPTLLIAGELDHKYVAIAEAMHAAMPQAALAIVANAGHAVHLERPQQFVDIVRGFLLIPARLTCTHMEAER
ncbi:MAG: 2-succinyl-6-hydroxy-2,4-cyclohexadiene-1-carboxylate synthase [Chloroflexia bacterium]|nr:2-succinyl-6-hydroxy-2,4-cyclohexadiene-1-carboxylate synthase [Chloroflexia bacterium]